MVKVHLDPLVLETFRRIYAVHAFIDWLDHLPDFESRQREELKQLASQDDLGFDEYNVESRILDAKFGQWLPQIAAYSAIILLDSLVETQLLALAQRVSRDKRVKPLVKKGRDSVLNQTAAYLSETAAINLNADPAWKDLIDLRRIRNVIVHRAGRRGDSKKEHEEIDKLLQTYRGLALPDRSLDSIDQELDVPMRLCEQFAEKVEGFFERLFNAAGLPNRFGRAGAGGAL